ncbi:MAG: hypothetical protein ACOC5K_04980 [Chloroflexota bacterium]
MRQPPPYQDLDLATMTAPELGDLHRRLGEWLDEAMVAEGDDRPPDDLMDAVHEALVAVAEERADRQPE